jgi:hypothetical protein
MGVNEVINELNRGLGKFTHEHYRAESRPGAVEVNDLFIPRDNESVAKYTTVHELQEQPLLQDAYTTCCRFGMSNYASVSKPPQGPPWSPHKKTATKLSFNMLA